MCICVCYRRESPKCSNDPSSVYTCTIIITTSELLLTDRFRGGYVIPTCMLHCVTP